MNLPEDILYKIILESDVLPLVFVNKTLYSIFKMYSYQLLTEYNLMFQRGYLSYEVIRAGYHISFCDINTCPKHIYNKIRYIQNPGSN